MKLGMEVGLSPGDTVLAGDPALPPLKRAHSTSALLFVWLMYCGQTTGWIKMPLGMEVGLDPGHIVLDRDTAPPKQGHSPLLSFRSTSIVAKRSPILATTEATV